MSVGCTTSGSETYKITAYEESLDDALDFWDDYVDYEYELNPYEGETYSDLLSAPEQYDEPYDDYLED